MNKKYWLTEILETYNTYSICVKEFHSKINTVIIKLNSNKYSYKMIFPLSKSKIKIIFSGKKKNKAGSFLWTSSQGFIFIFYIHETDFYLILSFSDDKESQSLKTY